jgi:TonB family protein
VQAPGLHDRDPEAHVLTALLFLLALMSAGPPPAPPPDELVPARLVTGGVPPLPVLMVSGGEVVVELIVDVDGRVAAVRPLRATPPFTSLVSDTVKGWRFDPSQRIVENTTDTVRFAFRMPRVSKVLVAAVFRPPAIWGPTLGRAPVVIGTPDPETPYPLELKTPAYPPQAFGGGVVLVEILVDTDGSAGDVCIIESAPPFDAPALDAARRSRFLPARVEGRAVPAYAYIVYGFPVPISPGS